MNELDGKVIFITGGSRGIGAATVIKALNAGAFVILHYGSSHEQASALVENAGAERCIAISADLADPAQVEFLWDKAISWRGHIDCLINNAAIYECADHNWTIKEWRTAWLRTLQVNLQAPADLCKSAIDYFSSQKNGIIINVTSRGADRGEMPNYAHYSASKGGLASFTRTIARSHAKDGILAYIVSPGWTETKMAKEGAPPGVLEAVEAESPLGGLTQPEDVAEIIVFLASGRASHATGGTIDVNGGSYIR